LILLGDERVFAPDVVPEVEPDFKIPDVPKPKPGTSGSQQRKKVKKPRQIRKTKPVKPYAFMEEGEKDKRFKSISTIRSAYNKPVGKKEEEEEETPLSITAKNFVAEDCRSAYMLFYERVSTDDNSSQKQKDRDSAGVDKLEEDKR